MFSNNGIKNIILEYDNERIIFVKNNKKVLILTDYKNFLSSKFLGTVESRIDTGLELDKIVRYLSEYQFETEISEFSRLDMSRNFYGYYVLYASSEEKGLFYKEYIMDILLRLYLDGAKLLPEIKYFRAHHNKVFAELLRTSFQNKILKRPLSISLGHYDEYLIHKDEILYPCIIKTSSGSGSKGVRLARSADELEKHLKEMMRHTYRNQEFTWLRETGNKHPGYEIKKVIKKLKGEKRCAIPDEPYRTNKIIIQEFIEGLTGDYKVIFLYGKYYVLSRKNRDNDFRASGSGKFHFPKEVSEINSILNFAYLVSKEIDQPFISMDIAQNEGGEYLIEFQCLYFGTYTVQFSNWYFEYNDGKWTKVETNSEIEKEYCRAIAEYIGDK